ncbi:MAG: BLUF domain-containing protein, partial [Pseudomonadota bacterium]
MIRILYVSRAVRPMTNDELDELLETCRENNARKGVTGMLLYFDRIFIQIFEGEDAVVDALLRVIEEDPRHKGVTVLERTPITKRQFSNWSMGFRKVGKEGAGEINGLADLLKLEGGMEQLVWNKELAASLLTRFRDEQLEKIHHEELPTEHEDRLIRFLHLCIRAAVRVLAVLMVLLIFWGVGDVVY